MGPISDFTSDISKDAISRIIKNTDRLDYLKSVLSEPEAYTKSGRAITNPLTSRAIMTGANGYKLGAAEGKTVAQATKEIARITNENAILRAVAILGADVPTPPSVPKAPPSVATPGLMSKLNPILAALQLMTYSGDLNESEDKELAARRNLPPTITGQ
jgi:hypothetical protein